MGISIHVGENENGIDMGYHGFLLLRQKIAELSGEKIGQHYSLITTAPWIGKSREDFFEKYDQETDRMVAAGELPSSLADFLYQPDVSGEIPCETCEYLLKIIGDYDDDTIYGYAGRPDAAKFSDFKDLLQECVKQKAPMVWS